MTRLRAHVTTAEEIPSEDFEKAERDKPTPGLGVLVAFAALAWVVRRRHE